MLHALSNAGANFLIVGAYAVSAYAEPRSTGDIDLWIEPSAENAPRVFQALRNFGAPMVSITADDFSKPGLIFQLGVPPVRIDILTAIDGVEFATAWARRSTVRWGDEAYPVIGFDDLLANKLAAGRPKDLLDHALLLKHGKPGTRT